VDDHRRIRILAELVAKPDGPSESQRLCDVCAVVTAVTGAGIMLMVEGMSHGSLCTSNSVSALIGQLQYTLGEGPSVDAYEQDRPVLEPDLVAPRSSRWVAFAGPAVDAGVRAVFGFPLRLGAIRLGALSLYSDQAGCLTDEQHADALVMADVAARAILLIQADAPPGTLADELIAAADLRYHVHQATGMVAAQLDIDVREALIRLRAYAFASDRALADVADDVVARRLRFDESAGEES
jgi:ANTAR domain